MIVLQRVQTAYCIKDRIVFLIPPRYMYMALHTYVHRESPTPCRLLEGASHPYNNIPNSQQEITNHLPTYFPQDNLRVYDEQEAIGTIFLPPFYLYEKGGCIVSILFI
jgi:hypothetical protein